MTSQTRSGPRGACFQRASFWQRLIAAAFLLSGLAVGTARGDEPPSFEQAAEKLQAATVTVRVTLDAAAPRADEAADAPGSKVTVCSGVSLGDGLVVTSAFAAADSRIRVTLSGGRQANAKLLVLDDYTNLSLLQIDRQDLPGMELTDTAPKVGSWVVSAAAWGAEDAVVSLGIVAGTDRMLEGGHPPLLQCDLRTDDTSAGAGVVDRDGRLLGIVVVVDRAQKGRGWTFAVPARHVQRLLNGRSESLESGAAVILKRRRPTVGMVLDSEAGEVVVRRVHADSAADKAGVQMGDVIVAADGVNIRSVYQAVRPILHKQPGDEVEFLVKQEEGLRRIRVVLEGGVELPAASLDRVAQYVRPSFQIEEEDGYFVTRDGRGELRDVIAPDNEAPAIVSTSQRLRLLERAIDRYLNVIVHLRDELGRREKDRLESEQLIQSLQEEVANLKRELETSP